MLLPVILASIVMVSSPAGPNAMAPHLTTTNDGTVAMSWLEGSSLKMAAYNNGKWSAPRVIAKRNDFWANWADFPSILRDNRGTWFAHWLQRSGPGTYSYDVMITSSADGVKWRTPRVLHTDGTKTEHGFVSMVKLPKEGVAVTWLDGREMEKKGPMTLRYATLDAALNVREEKVLDPRVCECCTTAMARTNSSMVVAYRDRTEDEIRDISFISLGSGKPISPLHKDGWKINGCPVNGPQLDAFENTIAAAWFTAADNEPRVLASFSRGRVKFAAPLRIDTKNAVGRVDVIALDGNSALVSWIEGGAEDAAIYARVIRIDGRMDPPMRIAPTSSARGSGFPRMTRSGEYVYIAWTDPAAKTIRVARIKP
jgi:hypothetical protein